MTANEFRRLALRLPEATEGEHMDHADFRVRGKIFASLGPREEWGMVKLTPEEQASLLAEAPGTARAASGSWGARGATILDLEAADPDAVGQALIAAWRNTAPKRLVREWDDAAR